MNSRSKVIVAALAVVLVVVIVVAAVINSYQQVSAQLVGVDFVSVNLKSPLELITLGLAFATGSPQLIATAMSNAIDSITIRLHVTLTNNGFLPIDITSFSYTTYINGNNAGTGSYSGSISIPAGGSATILVTQDVNAQQIPSIVASLIQNWSDSTVTMSGHAHTAFFDVPVQSSFSFNIAQAIENKILGR